LSTWALFFERLWPRLWLLVGLGAVLAVLSLTGAFLTMPPAAHMVVIGAFGVAALGALIYAGRVSWPTREEAIRRIERRSGVAHRPATSYEDTLNASLDNPATNILWQAHRERLARAMARLRVGNPSPRADRADPLALRILPLLLLVPAIGLVSGSFYERLMSAFKISDGTEQLDTRVDAWVTPPAYTGKPPIMLADGNAPAAKEPEEGAKLFEVPVKSTLTLRGSGFKGAAITFEVTEAGIDKPITVTADPPKDKLDIAEARFELKTASRVTARAGGRDVGNWTFDVIPDQLPKITLNPDWRRTAKGSLKLSYKGEDDYGIASAVAKVRQLKDKPDADRSKAWARPDPVKGPRLPLERPPEIALKLPHSGVTSFESTSMHELGKHPWAGQTVELWLEATDVAGQIGRSERLEIVLPMRAFRKPLARAVIEQRRKLAEDSRNRPAVVRALDALTIEPEGFIEKTSIYLALRSIYHRIERENSREAIASAVDQMWDVAVKIEDGQLSDAEQALKDARDRLAKALEEGASEEEIKALMQEMKEAMNRYLEEMQKNAEKDGEQQDGDEQKQVSQEDMEQMLRDLEEAAKNGSREEAEKLLAEMQEMMENMRGQTPEEQAQQKQAEEMMKRLDDLSELSGRQQKLMDDTFDQQKSESDNEDQGEGKKNDGDQAGANQRKGNAGQQGQQRGKQKDEGSQSAQQGGNPDAQSQQGGQGRSQGNTSKQEKGGLKDRQSELRKKLEKLQQELEELGAGGSERLKDAEASMKSAEEALEQGDMEEAGQSQAEALEQMRESAQKMAEQMQKNGRQRGPNQDARRDPLDRPQRADGPDIGNSVKVPRAIEAQRAREILEELRRRSGEALRPPVELDYIDRLLKRF
jgi:uncharacterized protein (TIGR02302 family)